MVLQQKKQGAHAQKGVSNVENWGVPHPVGRTWKEGTLVWFVGPKPHGFNAATFLGRTSMLTKIFPAFPP